MNIPRKIAACVATWLIAAHPALALNDTIGVTTGSGKTANLIAFSGGNVISEVGICDATTANQCAAVSAGGALLVTGTGGTFPISGTLTAVTAITNALPAGTNVIGHVIADTGSTTAVTGTVTVGGTVTANAGTNLNTSLLALEAGGNLASIKTDTDRLLTSATRITAGAALASTSFVVGSRYLATPPTFTDGQEGAFQIDSGGRMLTSSRTFGATGAALDAATGVAVPANALQVGMAQGGNLVALTGTTGNLNVQCANCSGSGVSVVDAAAWATGSSVFAPGGGVFNDGAAVLSSGTQGTFRLTTNRALHTNLRTAAGAEIGIAAAPLQVSLANTAANGTNVAVSLATETAKVIGTVRNVGNGGGVMDAVVGATYPANALAVGVLNGSNIGRLVGDETSGLWVNIKAGAGSGGTALADNNVFTQDTTNATPASCLYATSITNLTAGNAGVVQCTNDRRVYTAPVANNAAALATWTSGTANGTNIDVPNSSLVPNTMVTLTQTSITGSGSITFRTKDAAGNYVNLAGNQLLNCQTLAPVANPFTLATGVANFCLVHVGYQGANIDLSTAPSGGTIVVSTQLVPYSITNSALLNPLATGTATIGNVNMASEYPVGAVPITATGTGTTGTAAATLAASGTGLKTYVCSMSLRSNATAAANGVATLVGVVTATMNFQHWTAPLASGIGITEMIFKPCVPSSATNTAIVLTSPTIGTGGNVTANLTGFQAP